jgi:two-component system C4-dicarboxylate transport sensor histidine kinase DctB
LRQSAQVPVPASPFASPAARRAVVAVLLVAVATILFALIAGRYARDQARASLAIEVERTARQQMRLLDSELQKFRLLPIVLREFAELRPALASDGDAAAERLDGKLKLLAERTGAPVIYLVDRNGLAVAASNADRPDSFAGQRYDFRPYFLQAKRYGAAEYFAIGTTSGRAGLFLARRIGSAANPDGVIVVKMEFDRLERAWRGDAGMTLLTDATGVVVVASDPTQRFTTLRPLTATERQVIRIHRQFADQPLPLARWREGTAARAAMASATLAAPLPGWRLLHVEPLAPALHTADTWSHTATLAFALIAAGLATGWLWRTSRGERAAARREALEAEIAARTGDLRLANDRLRVEITERMAADQRFRAAREELAQANRLGSLGQITAGIAHEINQPVATIRTLAENGRLFLDRARPERTAENLATIAALTERIGSIVSEMRRFARRGSRSLGPIPLTEVIEGTMLLVGDRLRAARVALDLPEPDDLPMVVAGRVRLEQVLVNLLTNALDALAGRAAPRVALLVATAADTVALTVADNGPGIAEDRACEIFTPFVTGRPDGLGLGLGIARDIVVEFGGTLDLIPSPLGGAAFRMILPRA